MTATLWRIDDERPGDEAAIRAVHLAAFPTDAEANLVDMLRANGHATVSLVARLSRAAHSTAEPTADDIVGHVLFSPVTIERDGRVLARGVGLAPLAVLPAHQNAGIGSALARAGLAAVRALGAPFCVVLGEPSYYARFGFRRAIDDGIDNEYGARDEFMLVSDRAALPSGGGLARYSDEFRAVSTS